MSIIRIFYVIKFNHRIIESQETLSKLKPKQTSLRNVCKIERLLMLKSKCFEELDNFATL